MQLQPICFLLVCVLVVQAENKDTGVPEICCDWTKLEATPKVGMPCGLRKINKLIKQICGILQDTSPTMESQTYVSWGGCLMAFCLGRRYLQDTVGHSWIPWAGVDPGFWSGGVSVVLSPRGTLSPKFAQNGGFLLKIAWKLHDFEELLVVRGARAPRIRYWV